MPGQKDEVKTPEFCKKRVTTISEVSIESRKVQVWSQFMAHPRRDGVEGRVVRSGAVRFEARNQHRRAQPLPSFKSGNIVKPVSNRIYVASLLPHDAIGTKGTVSRRTDTKRETDSNRVTTSVENWRTRPKWR